MSNYGIAAFIAFYLMLGGLLLFHKRKNLVVYFGFAAATFIFLLKHNAHFEIQGYGIALLTLLLVLLVAIGVLWSQRRNVRRHRPRAYLRLMAAQAVLVLAILILTTAHFEEVFPPYLNHLGEHHRFHLLWNLAAILPGFALVSYYFERSGAAAGMARSWFARTDARVLWCVFSLSILLDNIAAAMIGATVIASIYGHRPPFRLIVAIVMASNLGGAPSPVGDTTTVMIFMANVCPVTDLFKGFVAVLPVQFLLTLWASRHQEPRLSNQQIIERAEREVERSDRELHVPHCEHQTVSWRGMWPLLGVIGLLIGNLLADQPALGLWAGMLLGLVIGRIRLNGKELLKAMPNTTFLVTLVATAELLPLEELKPFLNGMSRDKLAVLLGLKSAWLDNIPLTAISISLGGFAWGLLAYCVGVGGSSMWFGSSAGVAVGQTFHEAHDTKKWAWPFVVMTFLYFVGVGCYLLVWRVVVPALGG
ncbi:MAG: hypothetical protein K8U57_32350 [Planctomycetes bacterium]|nr:hypothetical protein [Planctomycetota bacterium]